MVPLTPHQRDALAEVKTAWPDARIALVGAVALACHIPLQRLTDDLDLVVAITADRLPGPLATRRHWQRHQKMEHRFFYKQGTTVDILPAAPELIAQGYIEWPSGHRMSLVGFDLAFDHGAEIDIGDQTSLWVPCAATIALLKMCAWLDKPNERDKDLGDLAKLLDVYVATTTIDAGARTSPRTTSTSTTCPLSCSAAISRPSAAITTGRPSPRSSRG